MKLIELLKKENSKRQKDRIVAYIGNEPKRFKELVDIYLEGPYRITQRAAWPLSYCAIEYPALLKPHFPRLIKFLSKPNQHDAVKRNTLRFLQFVEIPKSQKGHVVELCFQYLTHLQEPIAVRVFAMTVLTNLAKEYPELKNELIPMIENQLPFGSAGFRSRALKCLKVLKN